MPDSTSEPISPSPAQVPYTNAARHRRDSRLQQWLFTLVFSAVVPVMAALLVYQLDPFDPAPIPMEEFGQTPIIPLLRNHHMLQGAEFIGAGKILGPEDMAYDSKSRLLYTGCEDGWIKRVRLNDSTIESLVNTNGRPLGVALGHNNEIIVADAYKGLLNISRDGKVELLTDEADGLKLRITDGVDIADNGMIYFTDASYKYELHHHFLDLLEGKPHGRLMSFNPDTRKTKVLVGNIYFANGVAVSPSQDSAIFCESTVRRCRKYYIQGNKKGQVEKFVDNLPGFPDNIKYDGDGHYWIGISSGTSVTTDLVLNYPFIRKALGILEKNFGLPRIGENAGVLSVDLEGKPIAHYLDHKLTMVSTGMKIENSLYCGSVVYPHIISLYLDQHPQ